MPELLIDYAEDGTTLEIEAVSPGFVTVGEIAFAFERLGLEPPPTHELAPRRLTNVADDKGAMDCARLRRALLFDSLAAELGRWMTTRFSMSIKALIRFIDGGAGDHYVDDVDLARLAELEESGLSGKALIDAWITDDWGAPPTDITIRGITSSGKRVDRTLNVRSEV